ncbi:MAG: hypothetical protein J6S26_02400 [Solobacterium sp.]|nr:hypothetical protein [Solobacterium sp.]
MTLTVGTLLEKSPAEGLEHLSAIEIVSVQFYRSGRRISCTLKNNEPLAFQDYAALIDWLKETCFCPVDLAVNTEESRISAGELDRYLQFLYEEDPETALLRNGTFRFEEDPL